jgi:hypothetical protein
VSLDDQLDSFSFRFAQAAEQIVLDELRAAAPKDTGKLRASIKAKASVDKYRVSIVTETLEPQAMWTEFGTRPHIIPTGGAAAGKILAFHWKRKGVFVVTREVHHPGTKPMRWFQRTMFHWDAMVAEAARRASL